MAVADRRGMVADRGHQHARLAGKCVECMTLPGSDDRRASVAATLPGSDDRRAAAATLPGSDDRRASVAATLPGSDDRRASAAATRSSLILRLAALSRFFA